VMSRACLFLRRRDGRDLALNGLEGHERWLWSECNGSNIGLEFELECGVLFLTCFRREISTLKITYCIMDGSEDKWGIPTDLVTKVRTTGQVGLIIAHRSRFSCQGILFIQRSIQVSQPFG
jgi:hypothetical protein